MSLGSKLKIETLYTLAWIAVFPFLVAWPFVSAFPAFSLIGSAGLDLATALNLIFLITGFWPLAGIALVVWALLRSDMRSQVRWLRGKGLLIGFYASLWTGLYMIAAMTGR